MEQKSPGNRGFFMGAKVVDNAVMKRPKPVARGLILFLALTVSAGVAVMVLCKPAPRGITADSVRNIAYPGVGDAAQGARLSDGQWREPVSWHERVETVKDWLAGDRSGPLDYGASRGEAAVESSVIGTLRGKPAAAVIFWESGGGSGTFMNMGLVVEQEGKPVCVATQGLGDRTQVLSKKFDHDQIVLELLRVGESDSYADPTDHVRLTYRWDGGDKLVPVSAEKLPPVQPAP